MSHRGGAVLGDGFPSSAEQQICERENQLGLDLAEPVFESSRTQLQQQQEEADDLAEFTTETWTHEGIKSILDEYGFGYIEDWTTEGYVPEDPYIFDPLFYSCSVDFDYEYYEGVPDNQARCYYVYDEAGWIFAMWATMYPTNTPQFTKIYLENDLDFGGYLYDVCDPVEAGSFHGFWGEIDGQGHTISNVLLTGSSPGMFLSYGIDLNFESSEFNIYGLETELVIPSKLSNISIDGISHQTTTMEFVSDFFAMVVSNTIFDEVNFDVFFANAVAMTDTEAGGALIVYDVGYKWTEELHTYSEYKNCKIYLSTLGNVCATVLQTLDWGLISDSGYPSLNNEVLFDSCAFYTDVYFDYTQQEDQDHSYDFFVSAIYATNYVDLRFYNCSTNGNIYGLNNSYDGATGYVGLIGSPQTTLTIENCNNYTNIAALDCAGYYVGGVNYDWYPEGGETVKITNSNNYGDMYNIGDGTYSIGFVAGFVCGQLGTNIKLENCINYGDIYCAHIGGGIIALEDPGTNCSVNVKNCSNFGSFYYPFGSSSTIGGIMATDDGSTEYISIEISGCDSDANVIANAPEDDMIYGSTRHSNLVFYGGIFASNAMLSHVGIKNCNAISHTKHIYNVGGIISYEVFNTSKSDPIEIVIDGCSAQNIAEIGAFEAGKTSGTFGSMFGKIIVLDSLGTNIPFVMSAVSFTAQNCVCNIDVKMQDVSQAYKDNFIIGTLTKGALTPATDSITLQNIESRINIDNSSIESEKNNVLRDVMSNFMTNPLISDKEPFDGSTFGSYTGKNLLEDIWVELSQELFIAIESFHILSDRLELTSFAADSSIYEYHIRSTNQGTSHGYYNGAFSDEVWFWNAPGMDGAKGHYINEDDSFPLLRKFYAVGEGMTYSIPDLTFEDIVSAEYTKWQAA